MSRGISGPWFNPFRFRATVRFLCRNQKVDVVVLVDLRRVHPFLLAHPLFFLNCVTPDIFEQFWQADQARSYQTGGFGLGLAIAQGIVQNHGGEITVTSEIGRGSCFKVGLPAYQPQ
jgi:hypothetical protein